MRPARHPLFEALINDDQHRWREWRSGVDLDHMDDTGFNLLPMLVHRLQEWTADDPAKAIFSGIVRRAWTKNQLTFGAMSRALDAAPDCHLVLSGVGALALRWSALGMPRNVDNLEFQVSAAQFQPALRHLQAAGWQQQQLWPGWAAALAFGSGGVALTLRAHPGGQVCDEILWQGRSIRIANRESLFVHALTGAEVLAGLPWWCDARLILREGDMDWRAIRARLRAKPAESHLRLRTLAKPPASLAIPWRMLLRPTRITSAIEIIEDDYAASPAGSFPGFLCARWQVRPWQLPWAILSRLLPPGTLAAIAS